MQMGEISEKPIQLERLGTLEDFVRESARHRITFEIMDVCEKIQEFMAGILKDYYGDAYICKSLFPVDIRGIVKCYGIDIYETNLNPNTGFRIEKINGYYRRSSLGRSEINLEDRDSEFTKRYILAHEFAHFLFMETLSETKKGDQSSYCIDPLFPEDKEEILADICATFLMFPPMAVLDYLEVYTNRLKRMNSYPMNASEWLKELGQKAQISSYFTIASYQYIKIYMLKKYNTPDSAELDPRYKRFFKKR